MACFISWLLGIVLGLPLGAGLFQEYLARRTASYVVIPSPLPKAIVADFRRRERANKRALRRGMLRMRGVQ